MGIKNCPFCNNEVLVSNTEVLMAARGGQHTNGGGSPVFLCKSCDYELVFQGSKSQYKAVQLWNDREFEKLEKGE